MNENDLPNPLGMRIQDVTLLLKLWEDRRAAISTSELILLATIVGIGMIVGLTTYRDAIVQEMGDSAAAVSELNQGYSYDEVNLSGNLGLLSYQFLQSGSSHSDELDAGQPAITDPAGSEPMGISISAAPLSEGNPVDPPTG